MTTSAERVVPPGAHETTSVSAVTPGVRGMPVTWWVGLAAVATAATGLARLGFAHVVPVGGDNALYVAMAGAPWMRADAPWGLRPLGPALVWLAGVLTGAPPEVTFPVVNFVFTVATSVCLCACAWELGFRGPLVALPIVLLAPTYGGMYYLWNGYFPEPVLQFLFVVILLCLVRGNVPAFALAVTLATAAKETALLWLPCFYLATARSVLDARALVRTALVSVGPIAVFLLLVARIPSSTLEPGYAEHLHWFLTTRPRQLLYLFVYCGVFAFSVLPLLIVWRWREIPRPVRASLALVPLAWLQLPLGADWLRYFVVAQPVVVVASLYGWRRLRFAPVLLVLYVAAAYVEDWLFIHTHLYSWLSSLGAGDKAWRKPLLLLTFAASVVLILRDRWSGRLVPSLHLERPR